MSRATFQTIPLMRISIKNEQDRGGYEISKGKAATTALKVGKSIIIKKRKKVNVKKTNRKIGKENDNDVDADVAQLERSNN